MKWSVITVLFISIFSTVKAQHVTDVVKAEKAFAAYALEKNTRDAFLQFMDSSAIVFERAKPQQAKLVWQKRRIDKNRLIWQPSFAGIAASGDMGFTTGPWHFIPAGKDSAVACGMFNTIWIKTSNGEWKWIIDMGANFSEVNQHFTTAPKVKTAPATRFKTDKINADSLDASLNHLLNSNGLYAIADILHKKGTLTFNGWGSYNSKKAFLASEKDAKSFSGFKPLSTGTSSSNDMIYSYGIVQYQQQIFNYLRVFIYSDNRWQLIIQTIG